MKLFRKMDIPHLDMGDYLGKLSLSLSLIIYDVYAILSFFILYLFWTNICVFETYLLGSSSILYTWGHS